MLIAIGRRKGKTIYITASEMEARRKRNGVSHIQFFGRITSDSQLNDISPRDILFGPNYDSLAPDAPAGWTPDMHRDYMKRHG